MPRENRGPHLWQDERSGIWHVRHYAAGKRALASTGTRSRAEAEAFLGHFLIKLSGPALPSSPTVANVLEAFVKARSDKIAAKDIASKCAALSRHIGWMPADTVTAAHVRHYTKKRLEEKRAKGTIIAELKKLRAALRWAAGEGLIPAPRPLPLEMSAKPRSRWLTDEEVTALLGAAVEPHVRLYLMLSLHTAARREAILDLPWSAVDLERGIIAFPQKEGGKFRTAVPINDQLAIELQEANARRTTDWVIEYAGQRVKGMVTGWRKTLARAKIAHCTRHDLRRTAGSIMLQEGASLELVSAVLGHSDTAITRKVYAHLVVDHLRPAVARLAR